MAAVALSPIRDFATSWSTADQLLATEQGWLLSETSKEDTPLELQRDDEMGVFPNDEAAWLHVYDRANSGCEVSLRALTILRTESQKESAAIRRYVAIMRPNAK